MVRAQEPSETVTRLTETGPEIVTSEALERAVEAARDRAYRAQSVMEELRQMVAQARAEERLLANLLALRRGEGLPERDAWPTENTGRSGGERLERASGHPVVEQVIVELEKAGQPLHISQLMESLAKMGVEIPGSGNQANLISYLRRDPRIGRPARGMYALVAWGLPNLVTSRKRTKRRQRARRSSG